MKRPTLLSAKKKKTPLPYSEVSQVIDEDRTIIDCVVDLARRALTVETH
jgi:hypothetical protein